MIRYLFVPLLQLETPTFRKLGEAFIDGMSPFIPLSNYESRYFLAKRLAGIPGYQYDVDLSKEVFQRQIFTPEELTLLAVNYQKVHGFEYRQQFMFDGRMCLVDIKRLGDCQKAADEDEMLLDSMDYNRNIFGVYKNNNQDENCNNINDEDYAAIMKVMELKHPSELLITQIEDDDSIRKYQNDKKFYQLSRSDQRLVKLANFHVKLLDNKIMRPILEAGLSYNLFKIERYTKSLKR